MISTRTQRDGQRVKATFSACRKAGSCARNQSRSFLSGICRFLRKLKVLCEIWPAGTIHVNPQTTLRRRDDSPIPDLGAE